MRRYPHAQGDTPCVTGSSDPWRSPVRPCSPPGWAAAPATITAAASPPDITPGRSAPGYGVYVFDRFGHRRAWNDGERRHWGYNGGGWRGNHLYGDRGFDARRDRAYMADRSAALRGYRSGPQGGRSAPQGTGRPQGHPSGDHH